MSNTQKFLQFNGKNIVFLTVDGVYWIAIKPILDAINMDADRSIKTLKNDPILGPARSLQAVQVSKNGKNQLRNMTCLPEKYIYGWIFSLRSDSPELVNYKRECYELLYNHFHGTITNRKEILMERQLVDKEIAELRLEMKEKDTAFQKMQRLQNKRKSLSSQLNKSDQQLIKQPELFQN